ncbi:7915_t:CDS:2, partial [Scutellospora calospora]
MPNLKTSETRDNQEITLICLDCATNNSKGLAGLPTPKRHPNSIPSSRLGEVLERTDSVIVEIPIKAIGSSPPKQQSQAPQQGGKITAKAPVLPSGPSAITITSTSYVDSATPPPKNNSNSANSNSSDSSSSTSSIITAAIVVGTVVVAAAIEKIQPVDFGPRS